MKIVTQHRLASRWLALPLAIPVSLAAGCADDGGGPAAGTGSSSGNGDADTAATDAADDTVGMAGSDGVQGCFQGAETCPCAAGNLCDPGLVCLSGSCVDLVGDAECGNGNLDAEEACDLGIFNADTGLCKTDCTLQTCGDGAIGPSEACDDNNEVEGDECTNACAFPTCGDGIVQQPEQCDDANADSADACLSTCLEARCGDGMVRNEVEECDDGNAVDGDGCESTCVYTVALTCGDGTADVGELCFTQTQLLAGKGPGRAVVVDLDGDAQLDLLAPNDADHDVWLWRGLGGGSFAPPVVVAVGGLSPIAAAVLDFDGDSELDIVTANAGDNTVSVLFGTSVFGVYDPPAVDTLAPGSTPADVVAANVDGDASGDFVVSLSQPGGGGATYVSFFYGTGSTTPPWQGANARLDVAVFNDGQPFSLAWGDPTGAGKDFLIATDSVESRVHALDFVNKTMVTQSEDAVLPLVLASRPHGIATGDLNGDGSDEIVTALWNEEACNYAADPNACPWNAVAVYYGNPAQFPIVVGKQEYVVQKAPWSPVIADLNGDGDLDVAVANGHSGTVSGLINDGGGVFVAQTVYHFGSSAGEVFVTAAELNGDGQADLILSRRASNTLSVLLSNP